jgi:UDP-N-acetylglucosamine transferase subunit ALG13
MIFVTVGTHEQPFDRMVRAVDELKERKVISDDVFIQTGYSLYKPRFCSYSEFIGFDEMLRRMAEAELVITHGGTGSIMLVLYNGKIPVVLPRQKKYNEHIDDHQVRFCEKMESKGKIVAAYEVADLENILTADSTWKETPKNKGNDRSVSELKERAGIFSQKLETICKQLVQKS